MSSPTIVVALDTSSASRQALAEAIQLAPSLKASITLVHAIDQDAQMSLIPFEHAQSKEVLRKLTEDGKKLVDDAAALAEKAGVVAHKATPHGNAAAAILGLVTPETVLVCMGHSHKETWLIGSVAKDVIAASSVPVLVVLSMPSSSSSSPATSTALATTKLRSMLIPCDGSDSSFLALHSSLHIGKALGGSITCLHIIDPAAAEKSSDKPNGNKKSVFDQVTLIASNHSAKVNVEAVTASDDAPRDQLISEEARKYDVLVISSNYLKSLFARLENEAAKVSVLVFGPTVSNKFH